MPRHSPRLRATTAETGSTRRSRAPRRALSAWSLPATSPASRVRERVRGSVGRPPRPRSLRGCDPTSYFLWGTRSTSGAPCVSTDAPTPAAGASCSPGPPDHRQPRVRDDRGTRVLLVLLEPPARSARLLPHDDRKLGSLPPEQQLHLRQLRHPGDVARRADDREASALHAGDDAPPRFSSGATATRSRSSRCGTSPTSTATISCSPATSTCTSGSSRWTGRDASSRRGACRASSSAPVVRTCIPFGTRKTGSVYSQNSLFGVLVARPATTAAYSWAFKAVTAGSSIEGSRRPASSSSRAWGVFVRGGIGTRVELSIPIRTFPTEESVEQ